MLFFPLGLGLEFKAGLEGAAPVPVCPPGWAEQLGHIWPGVCGRHGAHLAGQMWGCTKGSPALCLYLVVPAQAAGPAQETHGSPGRSRVGLGLSPGTPPGQRGSGQARRTVFWLPGWKGHMGPSVPA